MPTKASRIVYTCAILHNFLIRKNFNIMLGIDPNVLNQSLAEGQQAIVINENENLNLGTARRLDVIGYLNRMQ